MCQFMSFIITKGNRVFYNLDGNSSHEDIIKTYKLDDKKDFPDICRVEITPPTRDKEGYLTSLNKWIFKIDEKEKPEWFKDSHEKNVREVFKKHVKDFLKINCKCEFSVGFRICINAKVVSRGGIGIYYSSTSKHYGSSTSEHYNSSTSEHYDSSTSEHYDSSTSKHYHNSTSKHYGSSTSEHYNSSTSKHYYGSTSKHYDSSTSEHYDSSIAIAEIKSIYSKFIGKITVIDNAQRIDRK